MKKYLNFMIVVDKIKCGGCDAKYFHITLASRRNARPVKFAAILQTVKLVAAAIADARHKAEQNTEINSNTFRVDWKNPYDQNTY